jgi:hypothetical protein
VEGASSLLVSLSNSIRITPVSQSDGNGSITKMFRTRHRAPPFLRRTVCLDIESAKVGKAGNNRIHSSQICAFSPLAPGTCDVAQGCGTITSGEDRWHKVQVEQEDFPRKVQLLQQQ